MTTIAVKGHTFTAVFAKDSYNRRALQYKNKIISILNKIGVMGDDVIIDLEPSAKKNVDNLSIVYKIIELEVADLLSGKKTFEEFLSEFTEPRNVEQMRKVAREILGVEENVLDMAHIDKKYKTLAKKYHPDMPDGDLEMFKKINNAHKLLK